MNKKIIGILVMMLVLLNIMLPLSLSLNISTDLLDQYSDVDDNIASVVCKEWSWSQSFIPSLEVINRVELLILRKGNPTSDIIVSLKEDLNGIDLTYTSKSSVSISSDKTWVEFDFPDFHLTTGKTYFIVCKTQSQLSDGSYYWYGSDGDVYPFGDGWVYGMFGDHWQKYNPPFDHCFKTYGNVNFPPEKPKTPSGQINGKIGVSYTYSTITTDPNHDKVYYWFDWGDETNSGWVGPYEDNNTRSVAHTWEKRGSFPVKVKAKDEYGAESIWSEQLIVTMPKNKMFYHMNILLENLFQRFPFFEKILNQILKT